MKKLILNLIQKYFMKVDTDIRPGDLINVGDSDAVYDAIGVYYSYELKPFMFFMDGSGYIYSKPVYECRRAKKVVLSV